MLLRRHPNEVLPVVYQAVEQRAAADLSQVHIESAVDRGRVVRLSYLLLAAVVIFALYLLISPKNPFTSAARVLWPWSGIAPPTRVTIRDIRPGDTTVFYGEPLEVSADVAGLDNGEAVTLYYSTADAQSIDQPIVLKPIGDSGRYQCAVPPGNAGLQQDITYRLKAADCTTPEFKAKVEIAPTILVDQIEYQYPAYTGMPKRIVKDQGDIRAIEDVPTIKRLAEFERIVGIKDSSGDVAFMMRMMTAVKPIRPDFVFMTGWDVVLVPMLLLGVDGGTNAVAGVAPELTRKLYDLMRAGQFDEAVRLQFRLMELFDAMIYSADFPEGIRAAVELRGFRVGRSRQIQSEKQKIDYLTLQNVLRCILADNGYADAPAGGCPPRSGNIDQDRISHIAATVLETLRQRGAL